MIHRDRGQSPSHTALCVLKNYPQECGNALGDLFRRVGLGTQCRSGPGGEHAAGVPAPGRLGLRQFRHWRDGRHAGLRRIARCQGLQSAGLLARHCQPDAPVPVGGGCVHRFAGDSAQLPRMAGAAADDRGDSDHCVYPRRKLDQPTGGGAVARPPGGVIWLQLCPEPALGPTAAGPDWHRP